MTRLPLLALALLPCSEARAAGTLEEALREIATAIIGNLPEGQAPTLAISTFTHSGNTCSDLSNYASEIMLPTVQAVGGPDLRIFARSQLSAIFRELELVYDGTISPGAAQQIGEISGVEAILAATITPFGEQMMVISTLIATSDGGVLGSASASFPITGTVQGLMANQGPGPCGFSAAPAATAPAPTAPGDPPAPAPGPDPWPPGSTTFASDGFEVAIVSVFYAPDDGATTWSLRFRNTSETPIGLSYLPNSMVIADGVGGTMTYDQPVTGLKTCRSPTDYGYCNTSQPQYASTLPPGGLTQMNFTTQGAEALTDPRLTLTFQLVVTPDATDAAAYDVREVGFFDVVPVSR